MSLGKGKVTAHLSRWALITDNEKPKIGCVVIMNNSFPGQALFRLWLLDVDDEVRRE